MKPEKQTAISSIYTKPEKQNKLHKSEKQTAISSINIKMKPEKQTAISST